MSYLKSANENDKDSAPKSYCKKCIKLGYLFITFYITQSYSGNTLQKYKRGFQ